MANRTLGTITTMLNLNNKAFKKGIGNSRKSVNKFSKGVKSLGGMIAGAFAVRGIINFTAEASKLAAQMEGVAVAFERIQPNINFLQDLEQATAGTVSKLDLMRRAVMASNFKIPLTELASLLQFATKRAQETGESVDYLVNSIVIGIGRKSPLILDNLGISAVQLRQKLENVGHSGATVGDVAKAVGEIATESMKEMGETTETTAIRYERLNAEIANLKVEIGETANVLIGDLLPGISSFLDKITTTQLVLKHGLSTARDILQMESFMDSWSGRLSEVITQMKDIERVDIFGGKTKEQQLFNDINSKLSEYAQNISDTTGLTQEFWKSMFKGMKAWRGDDRKSKEQALTLKALGESLKMLKEELSLTPLDELNKGLIDQISALEQLIKNWKDYGQALPPVLKEINSDFEDMSAIMAEVAKENAAFWDTPDETWTESVDRRKTAVENFKASLGEMGDTAKEVSANIGIMLVNSMSSLGQAMGDAMRGVEDAFAKLGQLILENIGNILIMVGMSTSPIGWGLVAAGAAIQLGGGLLKGLGSNTTNAGGLGNPTRGEQLFRVQGKDLVTVLDRYNYDRSINT